MAMSSYPHLPLKPLHLLHCLPKLTNSLSVNKSQKFSFSMLKCLVSTLPVMAVHLAYPLEGLGVVVTVSGVYSVQPESVYWVRC